MGKTIFGLGDETNFLQSSSWGEVGNDFDVLDQMYGLNRQLRSRREQERTRILFKLDKNM